MDINQILQKVDECFAENNGQDAERILWEGITEAVNEGDDNSLLQLLNELLGYYRETSRVEDSFTIAEQALSLAKRMGLEGSIPYATTLLNVANAYRAGGSLKESYKCYLQVQEIYDRSLSPDNLLVASLENNLSLLYQEMGEFAKAKESQLAALNIVKKKAEEGAGTEFEVAVTYANLANTCLQLEEAEEAFDYARRAVEDFEKLSVEDAHYGAALTAFGIYYHKKEEYVIALEFFKRAMRIMEKNLGRNEYYYRLKDYVKSCEDKKKEDTQYRGLALCREYYETYGRSMLEEKFPEYLDKIVAGLVGEGSDCFGYDDAYSRDHDWGPDFCLWVTDATWQEIGEELQKAYEELPTEFKGFQRTSVNGHGRRGVMTIQAFYKRLLQTDSYDAIDWRTVSDASLAAAVNGEVFRDEEGSFTAFREKLKQGYPLEIRYLKLAESAAKFAQTAQYNYDRMLKRGDKLTAQLMLADGMREAMKLYHYLLGCYPPHDKWLRRSTLQLQGGESLVQMLSSCGQGADTIEQTAAFLAAKLYEQNFISDTESYLDAHTPELLYKAGIASKSIAQLSEEIAKLEFEAFDKVRNVGGRASCQNDWATFSIMRKSQYLTWNHTMLLQYLYDFDREYRRGHNLIEEKYGRMMESTAPAEYEQIKMHFPELSLEKKQIIEQIVGLQVGWMEEFASKYPALADNARSVHTGEDNLYNTSYETYLRGEISTYSDKMLELYGRYVVEYARENKNLTFDIMTNSVKLYGYDSLEAAEKFMEL